MWRPVSDSNDTSTTPSANEWKDVESAIQSELAEEDDEGKEHGVPNVSIVEEDEVDDESTQRMLMKLPFFHVSMRRYYYWVVLPLLFSFFVLIPFILVWVYYLNLALVFLSAFVAVFLSASIYSLLWQQYTRKHSLFYFPDNIVTVRDKLWFLLSKTHRLWQNELYQLILTVISCISYIVFTYYLSYVPDLVYPAQYDYVLNFPFALNFFICVEYFLVVSFSIDYLIGFIIADDHVSYVYNYYSIVDLLCFTGVAYFSFFHHGFSPSLSIYNVYLFQGPLRFMRMRRALKSLDRPVLSRHGDADPVLYGWGPFTITKGSAILVLVTFRIFLYLLTTAAIVLAVEYPCIYLNTDVHTRCYTELQKFHLCIYFVVVSISTVGYGDLVCVTDLGRMVMIFIVIGALMQVPAELDAWKEARNEALQREQMRIQAAQPQAAAAEGEKETDATIISTPAFSRRNSSTFAQFGYTPSLSSSQSSRFAVSNERTVVPFSSLNVDVLLSWCELQLLRHHSQDQVRQFCAAANIPISPTDTQPSDSAAALIKYLFHPSTKIEQQNEEGTYVQASTQLAPPLA